MRNPIAVVSALLGSAVLLVGCTGTSEDTVRVAVGHQSMCTDTYSGGIIVKKLGLLDKYLPRTGKYKNVTYEIEWKDYESGSPITNMMLANKIDFGVMGDYPLIVNGAEHQATASLRTLYVSGTGYNLHGSSNGVVVPVDSNIHAFEQLAGREVSVPFGSAAWGMVLKAMQDKGIARDELTMKDQSPPVGAANIAQSKIDAHADFCPWSEIMEFRGTGRKIYDGSETGIPYLHGVVVNQEYAQEYPEVVVAFLKAVIEAGDWVRADPVRAAEKLEAWTGVEKEVQYLYFSKGGKLTLDPTIKPKWVETLKFDHGVLAQEKLAPPLDFEEWIDDRYIRRAYAELNRDYERQLAHIHNPKTANKQLPPAELWHAKRGIVTYDNVKAMLAAAEKFQRSGQEVYATYVYDQTKALKLFAKVAFYVQDDRGNLAPFMRKTDASAFADEVDGKLLSYEQALRSAQVASRGPAVREAGASNAMLAKHQ